ncbi:MAG TPA: NAD-dependent epimerase/dehydratase family protein [Polyangiaceae bacterium]|nr:NAD-dependent epimerase/dehydratase family protein [Polyangiaceae bacterium]
MKVLVTGATGFVGRWVTRALREAGSDVVAFARRFPSGSPSRVAGVTQVRGDVLSSSDVAAAMSDVDAVIHCAGSVSLKQRDSEALELANVVGTTNVLTAAAARSIRVIHTSTTASIGPTREPRNLDEAAPAATLDFECAYVTSKRRAEAIALSYARDGLDIVVLNPGVVLGPGDFGATSTQIVLGYLTGQLRFHLRGGASFCDVRDVANAYVSALERGRKGERYLLAGNNRSHAELQAELQLLTGLAPSLPLPQPTADLLARWSSATARLFRHPLEDFNPAVVGWGSLFNYCDSSKAERELGYRARPLTHTLIDTITSHLQRGAAAARTDKLRQLLQAAEPSEVT